MEENLFLFCDEGVCDEGVCDEDPPLRVCMSTLLGHRHVLCQV